MSDLNVKWHLIRASEREALRKWGEWRIVRPADNGTYAHGKILIRPVHNDVELSGEARWIEKGQIE